MININAVTINIRTRAPWGQKRIEKAYTSPTIMDATKVPRRLPNPPITTTQKA
jgi:hypothetical protein